MRPGSGLELIPQTIQSSRTIQQVAPAVAMPDALATPARKAPIGYRSEKFPKILSTLLIEIRIKGTEGYKGQRLVFSNVFAGVGHRETQR